MASFNPNNNSFNPSQNLGFFSRALKTLSNWGMNYDEEVFRNKQSLGINEDPTQMALGADLYSFLSNRAIASILNRKNIAYLDRAYADKRRILREYSIKDEIRDYISTICEEVVIYDDDFRFCKPKPLPASYPQEVKDRYAEAFENIYQAFRFSENRRAIEMCRDLLVDGIMAYEIVWDDKKQNIIALEQMDGAELIPGFDPYNKTAMWIQNPEDPTRRAVMLDSMLVYISYKSQNSYSETSYVEGLIRPYNQLKLIEQTKIMFNITNASISEIWTIPVKEMPRTKAEEALQSFVSSYSENIAFDDFLGVPEINGSKNIRYNKQIWFPEGESGTPKLELLSPDGHNLNEDDIMTWFYNALKRASRIPFTRHDKESGGGNLYSNATEMTRDEIKFSNFISTIRALYMEVIVKPLRLQILRDFPEYMEDAKFINHITIEFNSNDYFEEWKYLANFEKRVQIIGTMMDSIKMGDKPYFHPEFLIDKFLKLTEEEKQLNESYWVKKPIAIGDGSGDAGFNNMDDFGGGSFGDSSPDDSSLDLGGGDADFDGDLDLGGGTEDDGLGGDSPDDGASEDFDF